MEELLDNIKLSTVWRTIHETNDLFYIMDYLKKPDIDYSSIEVFISHICDKYDIANTMITNKIITSIIMIGLFPDDLVGKERVDKEELVVSKADEIYKMFLNSNGENIHKKIVTFNVLFEDWKTADKKNQINILCNIYHQYNQSISEFKQTHKELTDDEILDDNKDITYTMPSDKQTEFIQKYRELNTKEKDTYLNNINSMKKKIINSLKRLTKDYKKHLDQTNQEIKYDNSVYQTVYSKMKHVYWFNIKSRIFEEYDINIYHQIIKDYIQLISDIRISNLDISSIYSIQEYDVNKDNLIEALHSLCREFISINKQVDSENYDDVYDFLINKLDIHDKYITDVLKLCFERLETIKNIRFAIDK